jgi:hypothetical protein
MLAPGGLRWADPPSFPTEKSIMKLFVGACLATVAFATLLASRGEAAMQLTTCGGTIPANEKGVLQNDVVCGFHCYNDRSISCSFEDDPVCLGHGICEPDVFVLAQGAVLKLNGHTIDFAYQSSAASCGLSQHDTQGRCIIKGPGTIQGGKGTGITSRGMNVVVKNLTISFTDAAIVTPGKIVADGLVIPHDRENSVYGQNGVVLKNTHLDGEQGAFSDTDLIVDHVEIGPHGGGLTARGAVRGRDVTIDGRGAVNGNDIVLRGVTSAPGVSNETASAVSATRKLRLVDANVVTIESGDEPVLVRSTCETSQVTGSSASWGVCSND